jgi:hypothetical protein
VTPWQVSYRGDEVDPAGNTLWGNELLKIVPFHGRLYATTGVECDATMDPTNPAPGTMPEPEIIVLNQSQGPWSLEQTFGRNSDGSPIYKRVGSLLAATFQTDGQGNTLPTPAEMLVGAATGFNADTNCVIYTGTDIGGGRLNWVQTEFSGACPGESGRATRVFHDPFTGVDRKSEAPTARD